MPTRPPRPCNHPGCPALTHQRYCDEHKGALARDYDRARGSRQQRGYGPAWERIRDYHLVIEPLCRECLKHGVTNAGSPDSPLHVDHIIRRDQGGSDGDENLQTLCQPHHNEKTARELLAMGGCR